MSLYSIIQSSKSLPIDTQMDLIYDHVDQLMWAGDWITLNSELDEIMSNFDDISLDHLLGVVCSTFLPGSHDLANRPLLVAKCKEKYPNPGLWQGL